jgi:hypothetical protein
MALAVGALVTFLPVRIRWPRRLGILLLIMGTALPIALDPLIDPTRATGRALWQWSAIGGPSVRASYDVDPLAAIALALTVAFTGAGFATASRMRSRHPALAALILAVGLVTIALVITDDLVAAIVVLAVVAALTVLALLAVAPPAATARAAGYLAIGLQSWILSALLISRQGTAGFGLTDMSLGAITPGAVLAATMGGLLFAGLYPVVAWSIEEGLGATDPGPLGSLVLMPAGIGASLLVLRVLGASRLRANEIALPEVGPDARLAAIVLVLLAVAVVVAFSGHVPMRPIAVGAVTIVLIAAIPALGWADVVLLAALLTAAYAGAVSLAMADHWETVRADLGLVALWIGIATGSPLGVAGGIVGLFARAGSAFASSLWLEPHREYIAFVGGSAVFVTGTVALVAGALATTPSGAVLGTLAGLTLLAVELVQLARRSPPADVPAGLAVSSGLAAILLAVLAAVVLIPLEATVRDALPQAAVIDATRLVTIAGVGAVAVILARTVRPVLPFLETVAARSGRTMRALDPVPIGVGAFRALEASATRASAAFGLFEQRAGVWLATLLIVALLAWAVR